MKTLITGASGFLGANLLRLIQSEHAETDEIWLLTGANLPNWKCIDHRGYTYRMADLIDAGLDCVDTLIHIGAVTPKRAEERASYENVKNVLSTEHLLRTLPNVPRKVIFISTISVYGDHGRMIDESCAPSPSDFYGASKLYCEELIRTWCSRNGCSSMILRLGQLYGPGSGRYAGLINTLIRDTFNHQDILLYSDGSERRSYLYAEDCCRMIRYAWMNELKTDVVNLVGHESLTVKEIARLIVQTMGGDNRIIVRNERKPGVSYCFDDSKMRRIFPVALTDFAEGIARTIGSGSI